MRLSRRNRRFFFAFLFFKAFFLGHLQNRKDHNRHHSIWHGTKFAGLKHGNQEKSEIGKPCGKAEGIGMREDQLSSFIQLIAIGEHADNTHTAKNLKNEIMRPIDRHKADMYTAGLSLWYFAAAVVIVVALFPHIWPKLSEYQQQRILVGFNPELDPERYGYQALKSRAAIAAGGFSGAGFSGGSYFKLIPEYKSDFLFAVFSEKFGFIGAFTYMALMGTLILRLVWIARHARKDCGANICIGVAAIMLVQSLENIGMCLGMLPVVGITLPFLSYGGSSMLASFIYIGVIQSIATHNQKYYFEREHA